MLRGWSYGDAFDGAAAAGKLTKEEVESDELNFKKLGSARVDAVLAIVEAGDAQIAAQGLQAQVKRPQGLLATNQVFLAFSKAAAQTELLARHPGHEEGWGPSTAS